MNVTVIDIGSNTIKATVFKINKKGVKTVLAYKGYKAKLITFIVEENGSRLLSEQGYERLEASISALIDFSCEHKAEIIFAFATASLRGVDNSAEIIKKINEKFDISIEILSGEEEAICSMKGLLTEIESADMSEGVMIDMGGGSTEIVRFANGHNPEIVSLPFGCLTLYKDFVSGDLPTDKEIDNIEKYVNKQLEKCNYVKELNCPTFLIGGSARAVCKVIYNDKKNRNLRADGSDFTRVINKLRDKDFYFEAEKIIPERTKTISPSSVAYRCIVKYIKPSTILVSDSGVREGYLEKILP